MIKSKNAQEKLALFIADNHQHESFPKKNVDYYDRFTRIDDHFNKDVHPNVNIGAAAREPIWLTDHGPEHISTVIRRAGDLTFHPDCVLSPYEAYILLIACHLHDSGNIFGRKDHEKKVRDVMFEMDNTLVGDNNFEKRLMCDIAMAHGGYVDVDGEDKDTIGKLKYDLSKSTNHIGVKKLAAILRFADELADDKTRTNRFIQEASKVVCPESEIFHAYAAGLLPVEIDHNSRSIEVHFELNTNIAKRTFLKSGEQKLLFDELFLRTLKMHREHVYCTRFMVPDVLLERINIQIDVCTNNYSQVLGRIQYTMSQNGYPDGLKNISQVCQELQGINSAVLVKRVNQLSENASSSLYQNPIDLLK